MAAGYPYQWNKYVSVFQTDSFSHSTWIQNGSPIAGSIPGAASICTNLTPGAIVFSNPTPPSLTYIGYFANIPYRQIIVQLKDRLSHMGGLSGTVITSQSVGLSTPPNRLISSDLTNVQWFVECYSVLGGTPQTLTITYLNTIGNTHTTTISIPANMPGGRLIPVIPTTSGDVIGTIVSCQLSGSTGTAGNFGFTCARHLLQSSCPINYLVDIEDVVTTGLTQIADSSCLWFVIIPPNTATVATITGSLKLIQG